MNTAATDLAVPAARKPIPAPRKRRFHVVERPTPKPRKRRLVDTTVSDAEMDVYIEELLAEMPKWRPKHPTRLPPPPPTELKLDDKQAFSFHLRAWRMRGAQGHPSDRDLLSFLKSAQTHIQRKLTEEVLDLRGLRFQLAVEVELLKDASNGAEVPTVPIFRTKQILLLQAHEIPRTLHEAFPGLLRRLENFTNNGSGWVVG